MGLRRSHLLGSLVALVLGLTGAAQATELSKDEYREQRRFAANNSMFVLYHEMAHLLFDQLQLPVLGREEDAADNVATWTLLNKGTERADQAVRDAARGWFLSGIAYDSGGVESDYAAAHALDKQRAYQIVCLMVGKDEPSFRPVAEMYDVPDYRVESCAWDYDVINRSLRRVLDRGQEFTGQQTRVRVTYKPAGGALREAADAFKSSGVFDQVADELRQRFRLPRQVRFNAERCGEPNAFYDPDTVEIIFCYELMQDYMDLYAAELPKTGATGGKSGTGKHKPPRN
ncbi:DUF4344 domain-containing metallopeptidase [Devosia aquimaris]|uniref:DUF4344 domain-containing metallopeptidase n=1 Tax=Devosia aquimaris TaxID=2866214 RepID=UPI001CD0D119|nr:DUF4344 domain-containing metallopeptidase [Devosia sp. CJK-A8-3]